MRKVILRKKSRFGDNSLLTATSDVNSQNLQNSLSVSSVQSAQASVANSSDPQIKALQDLYSQEYPIYYQQLHDAFFDSYNKQAPVAAYQEQVYTYNGILNNYIQQLMNILNNNITSSQNDPIQIATRSYMGVLVYSLYSPTFGIPSSVDQIDIRPSSDEVIIGVSTEKDLIVYSSGNNIGLGVTLDVSQIPSLKQNILNFIQSNLGLMQNIYKYTILNYQAQQNLNAATQASSNASGLLGQIESSITSWLQQFQQAGLQVQTVDQMISQIQSGGQSAPAIDQSSLSTGDSTTTPATTAVVGPTTQKSNWPILAAVAGGAYLLLKK